MTLNATRETQASPAVFKSLGLKALLGQMRDDRAYSILDLGPAFPENVRFWSQFSCRLEILDFHRSLRSGRRPRRRRKEPRRRPSPPCSVRGGNRLRHHPGLGLFNYFDLKALEALIRRLSLGCRPGTRLFTMVSDLPVIPPLLWPSRSSAGRSWPARARSAETRPCPATSPGYRPADGRVHRLLFFPPAPRDPGIRLRLQVAPAPPRNPQKPARRPGSADHPGGRQKKDHAWAQLCYIIGLKNSAWVIHGSRR